MNDDRFERHVASVIAGIAPTRAPDVLLDDVFLTTGRMRPRPRWLALVKEPPMRTHSGVAVGSPTFRLLSIAALTLILLLASLAAIGVGARVLSADGLPAPFGPARTGPLVYSAGGDIYLADADGGEPHAIITGPPLDQIPWFSFEGTKIAFGRGSEISRYLMVANADGSDAVRLAGPGNWWAEFLPGGTQMALVTWPSNGPGHLSIIDATTADTIRDIDLGSISVDWYAMPRPPDGHELVFRGNPDAESSDVALYAIGVDGSGLRMIGEPFTQSDDRWGFLDASLSPDGSTVVYWNQEFASPSARDSSARLHLRDLESGEELRVRFDPDGRTAVFSPDGTSILFVREISNGKAQLYVVPIDGSQPAQRVGPVFPLDEQFGFGYAPDGQQVWLTQVGESTLIDVATGATTELNGSGGPEAGGWQRLAN